EQGRIARDVLEALGAGVAPEVGADANMILAGDLGDVLDMVGDLFQRCFRLRMRLFPRGKVRLELTGIAEIERLKAAPRAAVIGHPLPQRLGDVEWVGVDHYH